jgi:hypothetical protein
VVQFVKTGKRCHPISALGIYSSKKEGTASRAGGNPRAVFKGQTESMYPFQYAHFTSKDGKAVKTVGFGDYIQCVHKVYSGF